MVSDLTQPPDYGISPELLFNYGTWQTAVEQESSIRPAPKPEPSHDTSKGNDGKNGRLICCPKRQQPAKASVTTWKAIRAAKLSQRLIGPNPTLSFASNCVETIFDWVTLLGETTFTSHVTSSDPCIIAAFRAVDKIILGTEASHLLRRLAYVQLTRVFVTLEAMLKSEREQNLVHRLPFQRDATVAIDIYMMAQADNTHPMVSRRELLERRRFGRAWNYLAGPSPLCTLMYSETAEPIVRDLWRKDSGSLKFAVNNVLSQSPWAVQICTRLTHSAEEAVSRGCWSHIRETATAEINQFLCPQVDDLQARENFEKEDMANSTQRPPSSTTLHDTQDLFSTSTEDHKIHLLFDPRLEKDNDAMSSGFSQQPPTHLVPVFARSTPKLRFSFASYATAVVHGAKCVYCNQIPSKGLVLPGRCDCKLQMPKQIGEKQKTITKFIQAHLPAFNLGKPVEAAGTNSEAEQCKHVLISQVRTWIAARKHADNSLMELAYENLVWELVYWVMSEHTFVSVFGDLVRYAYSYHIAVGEKVCHVLAQFAACVIEDVCLLDGWHELLTDVKSFGKDLVYMLGGRCA